MATTYQMSKKASNDHRSLEPVSPQTDNYVDVQSKGARMVKAVEGLSSSVSKRGRVVKKPK